MCHFSTISGGKQNCNNNNTFKILGSFPIQLLSSFHFHSLCFPCLSVCHPWKSMYVWCVCVCVGQVFWGCSLTPWEIYMSVFTHSYDVFHQLFQFLCVCVCVMLSVCMGMFLLDRCLGVRVSASLLVSLWSLWNSQWCS